MAVVSGDQQVLEEILYFTFVHTNMPVRINEIIFSGKYIVLIVQKITTTLNSNVHPLLDTSVFRSVYSSLNVLKMAINFEIKKIQGYVLYAKSFILTLK